MIQGAYVQWDTTANTDGAYALEAVAWDELGNSGVAAAVNVFVDNSDPLVYNGSSGSDH